MRLRARGLSIMLVAFVLLACVPSPARAQTYLTPYVGWDAGGNAGNCPSLLTDCTEKRTTYGVGVGKLVGGILGFELDVAYAPDFFGTSVALGSNSVLTLMGNLLLSIPAGPIRPYATAGAGLVRTNVPFTAAGVLAFSDSTFGYNIGGGVMVLLPAHLGVRGDVRYVRSGSDLSILGIGLPASKLNFSRVSIGLVLH